MSFDDSELREMLDRRSTRGRPPPGADLVSAATSARRSRLAGYAGDRLAQIGGVAVAAVLCVGLVVIAVGGAQQRRRTPSPTSPAPSVAASSSPAASPTATVDSPLAVVPRRPAETPAQVRVVQGAAVRWGGGSRYAACASDARNRTFVAVTDDGALDRWSAYVVLPVPGGNSLFRCDVAVAGDALVVLTVADPDREQLWLVSETGARELRWDTSGAGVSRIRGVGDRVLAIADGRSVVEIDGSGAMTEWDLPAEEPRAAEIRDATIDPLGRRWLLGRPGDGSDPLLTVIWVSEGPRWRDIQLLAADLRGELWLDGKQNPGPALPRWDEERGSTVLRAADAEAPWETAQLPVGSLPVGVLESGRLVTQQMTWLRVEQDPARVCKQGDAPCFRWSTLLAGLDTPLGPDDRRYVTVAGEDVVVTDRHGVRVIPSSNATAALSDEPDRSPLPTVARGENPIALTFRDATGLVTGRAAFVPPYDAALPGQMAVVNKAGLGRVLWVTWTTWGCERRPTVEFSKRGEDYQVRVNTGPHPAGGCDTVANAYAVEIRLARSIDADFVKIVFENPPP